MGGKIIRGYVSFGVCVAEDVGRLGLSCMDVWQFGHKREMGWCPDMGLGFRPYPFELIIDGQRYP